MRIAFTSCSNTQLVPHQQVWADILSHQPQHVVLLGDNIYNDVPDTGISQLQEMTTLDFAVHMWNRYRQQLAEPHFQALVQADGVQLHAIWDDHDFAWNNAQGGHLLAQPEQREKVYTSTSCMQAFRQALTSKNPHNFPQVYNDAALWANSPPNAFHPLGAHSLMLEADNRCWLHLTDGRTWRKQPDLLGAAQRQYLGGVFGQAPDALHIIASGSTFGGSEGWTQFANDLHWLDSQLGSRNGLMLSGDIHKNQCETHGLTFGRLLEATASGAALDKNLNPVFPGKPLCNFGLLEVESDHIHLDFYAFNTVQPDLSRRYARTVGGGLIGV